MKRTDIVLTPRGIRCFGRHIPCSIGRSGTLIDKREGDGATPIGVHRIVGMLYRPDRMPRPTGWSMPIRPRDVWSDDPQDPHYNLLVRAPHPHSHERLARADPLYDLVILTDWNWPLAVSGLGSAIFLHRWRKRGHPTEGCVAMSSVDLLWMAKRVRADSRLIVPG